MNIAVAQSGGPTVAINASLMGVFEEALKSPQIDKIYGSLNGIEGIINDNLVVLNDLVKSQDDVELIKTTPSTVLGSCRYKMPSPEKDSSVYEKIIETFKKYDIGAFFYIGGNDSMDTTDKLSKYTLDNGIDVKVIGIPKTIDNDIAETEVTFGFHTAIDVATQGIDFNKTTAKSHGRVMCVEIMGHRAGWLALYAGIAAAADVILLPEIPYDIKKVAKSIKDSKKDYAVVVVAEGAMSKKEAKLDRKAFKKARAEMKTTISARVAQEIEEETGIETRSTVLGYIQRGAEPSAYDRILATQFGTAAAEFIAKKEFGILVGMKNNKIVGIPLEKVEGKVKNIPEDFDLIQTARQEGISFGD
jgi:6-phosphofructokinase 1